MVHALKKARGLLNGNGGLLDIHPAGDPPPIDVRLGDAVFTAGWLREDDDYIEYTQADEAIAEVVAHGFFAVDRAGTFDFVTYADSLADFRAYLEKERTDAYLDELVARRIAELMESVEPDQEIALREAIRIVRLRPL